MRILWVFLFVVSYVFVYTVGGGFSRSRVCIPISGSPKSKLLIIVIMMIAGYYGIDLSGLLTGDIGGVTESVTQSMNRPTARTRPYAESPEEKELRKWVGLSLGSMEDVWHAIFKQNKRT